MDHLSLSLQGTVERPRSGGSPPSAECQDGMPTPSHWHRCVPPLHFGVARRDRAADGRRSRRAGTDEGPEYRGG